MLTLDTTPNGATSNSYAAVVDLRAYAETRFPIISWVLTATDDDCAAVLIASTRILDVSFKWTGESSTPTQKRVWGRSGMVDRNGNPIAIDQIPDDLISAHCELTLQINVTDILSDNTAVKQGVKSVHAGSVAVEFQARANTLEAVDTEVRRSASRFDYTKIPDAVRTLLVPSWYVESAIKLPAIIRNMNSRARAKRL